MWENEYKREIARNIVIGIILVAVLVGLACGYLFVRQQVEQEDDLLKEVQSSQWEELSAARQESKEHVNQVYQQHLNVLAKNIPGVVCWGDSLTSGSSGNVSYPHTLQKYLDIYISGVYDVRYSLDSIEGLTATDWNDYKISIPVVNMGAGRENTATVLGRSGVVPFVVSKEFVIPAGIESVPVKIVSESGKNVTPLIAGDGGVNPVTIAGVQGTLTRTTKNQKKDQYVYQFTRLEAGQEVSVEEGTQIITAAADAYRDYIHIVWLGTYDGKNLKPEKLVSDIKALLQRQNINKDRYLVISPCSYGGSWRAVSTDTMDSFDSAMLQAFGDRYINLRKYLMEDGLRDAKLTATKKDTKSIAAGYIPDSFRSNASKTDLNGVAYELLGKLVFDRMDRLGYLDEVREELNLETIIQDILNTEPKYFENRLNAY